MDDCTESEFAAFIGIDWADRKHAICLLEAGSTRREATVLPHRPEAITQWAEELYKRFHGRPIAVCLEIAKGPLVYALQRYAFLALFLVNPASLAKYRETFCFSGAKDDPSDAQLALEILLNYRYKLQRVCPQSAPMRVLEQLVEHRRVLIDDVRRITNRITSALKQYYPQVLDWFEDKDTLLFCDFISRWPTLRQAQRARKAPLVAFFHEHNVRHPKVIERRIQALATAQALTCDESVITPNRLLAESLVQQHGATRRSRRAASVGSVGDSFDNALAETVIGLYKTEVFHRRGPWRYLEAVVYATLEWVDWFNNRRILEPIGNIPPAELEASYYQSKGQLPMAA